jgi:SpoVK/Ycf46/Vps4 family AAA+-type ATPase
VELKLDGVPREGIDPTAIAQATPHFSGADIEGIVEAAKEIALAEMISGGTERPLPQSDLLAAAKERARRCSIACARPATWSNMLAQTTPTQKSTSTSSSSSYSSACCASDARHASRRALR